MLSAASGKKAQFYISAKQPDCVMKCRVNNWNIKNIDSEERSFEFSMKKIGKVTGSRLLSILGRDPYSTEFKAACQIARLFSEDTRNKYTEAGSTIEPIVRSYVRENWKMLLGEKMGLHSDDVLTVEDPIPAKDCGWDHFHENEIFGGMVDGYILLNGERYAVLEMKTSSDREGWLDEEGNYTKIPEGYLLQTNLYAELSKLDKIVFAVAFLTEADYDAPENFVAGEDNTVVIVLDKGDISEEMRVCEEWYRTYILEGRTPGWTEKDEELVDALSTNHIELLPDESFVEYRYLRDKGRDTSRAESEIVKLMASGLKGNYRKVEYRARGLVFTLYAEPRHLEVTEISRS